MKRAALLSVEYLLGFLALALFAYLAFSAGTASDERFVFAFKVSGCVALAELAVLFSRTAPANRLIVGAQGERRRVRVGSIVLLAAVLAALAALVRFRGTVQWAAVVPVIALSWVNRLLRRSVSSGA